VTVAAGVAIAGPGLAAEPPAPSGISAISSADDVRTTENVPSADAAARIEQAEAKARTAKQAATKALAAANKAKKASAKANKRAKQLRTASAVRAAQAAKAAAKKATKKSKAAKAAAAKAAANAEAVRRSASRSTAQRSFVADSSSGASTTSDNHRSLVLDLANSARRAVGCGPLTYNSLLEAAAQGHAEDMERYRYMGHVSKDGRTFDQRIRAAGFDGNRIGENVGAGFSNADSVVDAWMHSPAHRANILDCRFNYLGVGYALSGGYWVQNFGS
jgi:uncharacterized protein YkwD